MLRLRAGPARHHRQRRRRLPAALHTALSPRVAQSGGELDERLLGRCGFYCGACPTYGAGRCAGCLEAHAPGDCYTRDCVLARGLPFCGACGAFPCGALLERPRCTVLDRDWLRWKRREAGG